MNSLTQFKKAAVRPLLIALMLIVGAALIPVSAIATPQCGFSSANLLFPGTQNGAFFPSGSLDLMCRSNLPEWLLNTRVRGDSDLYITQNTIQPGGQSGWHTHPGPSLVTVTEGTITVYHPGCTVETYSVGQTFSDLGCGDIHNVVNETGAEAKTIAVQIVPHGAPRRIDEPDQGCVPLCP
jgi:quercetin dioxygenase-like cupin family protein